MSGVHVMDKEVTTHTSFMNSAPARWYHRSREEVAKIYLRLRETCLDFFPTMTGAKGVPASARAVLIISQRRLGDLAMEIPALCQFRESHASVTLGMVLPKWLWPLARLAFRPDYLFDYPENWWTANRLARRLESTTWDAVVDLTTGHAILPAWLAWRSGAPLRIGFELHGRGRLLNRVLAPDESTPMSLQMGLFLEVFGESFQRVLPGLDIPDDTGESSVLGRTPCRPAVGLHPGATHPTQRWPATYFGELAKMISADGGTCFAIGHPRESRLLDAVMTAADGQAHAVICHKGVLQLAAVLKRLDLLICNNSGPLHLAALLGVATLSVMGPTRKELWWPLDPRAEVLRLDDLECIGCNRGYCRTGRHECLVNITPRMMMQRYRDWVRTRGPEPC